MPTEIDDAPPVSPAAAWSSIGILMVLSLVSFVDRQIISLLVDPIKADLALSDTQISLLQGLAFVVFYSVAAIPIGWAVDRYPRRVICYLGVTCWSLCAAACGLASSFWQLFTARLGVGAGEACLNPASVSLISDLFPRRQMGTAMGVYAMAISLGAGAALIVGGFVISLFAGQTRVAFPLIGPIAPWQAAFIITGLPGVLVAFLAFLLADPRAPRAAAEKTGRAGDLRNYLASHWPVIAFAYAGFGFSAFAFYAVGAWTPAFLSRTFGLTAGEIGYAWGAVVALSGAGGCLLGGLIIDRCFRAGIEDAALLVPAAAALLSWPFLAGSYMLPSPTLVLIGLGLGTLMVGIISAGSLTTWQRVAPSEVRGRIAAGFGLASTGLGASLGPFAVALVTDRVFADGAKVGASLSIVLALSQPLLALSLLGSQRLLNGAERRRSGAVAG
jgi:MFS family permease